MALKLSGDKCFRCGRETLIINTYTEIINNSKVTTVQTICSDSICQKNHEDSLKREEAKRAEVINTNRKTFGRRNFTNPKRARIKN